MEHINLFHQDDKFKTILCLGAHCDDIEIGAGGSLLRLQDENPNLKIRWVIFSSNEQRAAEARTSAKQFVKNSEGLNLTILTFRESYFPYIAMEIKEYFDQLKKECSPDLIFTHFHQDLHQDHRLISELTWNTYRNHLILEYMIPKYEGDPGRPNFFINLPYDLAEKKANAIWNSFKTQQEKHWFSKETFMAVMRLQGIESLAPSGYSEGFLARKICY